MKVFVTGVKGQLGFDVMRELMKRGYDCIGSDIQLNASDDNYVSLDITDEKQVMHTLKSISPDAVIHCAAWTAVDDAESYDNVKKVFAINDEGTRNIAKVCKLLDCKMVYISTDYVFNGKGTLPWKADSKDFSPLNNYGQSKLNGEIAVTSTISKYFIVRTAWVFGINGNNFVKTMLRVGKKYPNVKVVNDQVGSPTYTYDLSRLLVDMIETDKYGYYHATNEGDFISWYDFCCEIYKQYGMNTKITPVSTAEYGLNKAARPYNSRLEKRKLIEQGFRPLPDWKDALKRYLDELKFQEN